MCSQRATCLLVFLNYFSASLIELSHHLLTFLLSYLSMYVLCKTVKAPFQLSWSEQIKVFEKPEKGFCQCRFYEPYFFSA